MKRILMMVALTATPAWVAACNGDDETPSTGDGDGDGDMTGDGDGDMTGDGDGDGDGDMTGDGDGDGDITGDGDGDSVLPECSDLVFEPGAGGAGGGGGAGGASGLSCEVTAGPDVEIEIAGSYTDQFSYALEVSNEEIRSGDAVFTLSIVDNDANYAVVLNSAGNEWNPCTWSTFVWHETEDGLYYCQSPYAATTECGALEAERPDVENLETGCNGFSWSQLIEN